MFGEIYSLMCLFLPSHTDLSHDCWWAILFTQRGENTSLLGKDCNLGTIDALYPTATSLRETQSLIASLCFSLYRIIWLQGFKLSNSHINLRLHIFVIVLKYLYCVPLYVVEFKTQRNPESTIKSWVFYLFGLNFITCIVYFLFFPLYFIFSNLFFMAFALISAVPEIKIYIFIFCYFFLSVCL